MGPWDINNEKVIPLAYEWLDQSGPLYVDVYRRYFFEQGKQYLIREITQFDKLIQKEENLGAYFSVFKGIFDFQGCFDSRMRNDFQTQFSEGERWFVLQETYYPQTVQVVAVGTHWSDFETGFLNEANLQNNVFIGRKPAIPDYWLQNSDENVMVLIKSGRYHLGSKPCFGMKLKLTNFDGIGPIDHDLVGRALSTSAFQCNIKLLEPVVVNGQTLEILEISSKHEDCPLVRINQKSVADLLGIKTIIPVNVKGFHSDINFSADLQIDE